jgi:hypothetical protein
MFNYNDNYYEELSDLVSDIDTDVMKEGDTIEVEDCDLEPIGQLNAESLTEWIMDQWEDRQSEDGLEYEKVEKVLTENIDLDKINALLPKLWYPNGKQIVFTYEQIMNEVNQ